MGRIDKVKSAFDSGETVIRETGKYGQICNVPAAKAVKN